MHWEDNHATLISCACGPFVFFGTSPLIKRAIAEGCGAVVVDLSMFADQGSSQFVTTMRVLPIQASRVRPLVSRPAR